MWFSFATSYRNHREDGNWKMLGLVLVFFVSALAADSRALKELQTSISSLIDQPKFVSMRWGMLIMTADGQVLFERDADKAFLPASTMKLFTGAVALHVLGPDCTMRTSVYTTQSMHAGVVHGDLILYGRGDPTLSGRFELENPYSLDSLAYQKTNSGIESLADQIKAQGIKRITGSLIGDESFFLSRKLGPGWECDDTQAYYAAEISALTVNDNCLSLTVAPSSIGTAPTITVLPQTEYVKILNTARTSESGQTCIGIHRPLNSNTIEIFGTIPRGAKEFKSLISIHDPALFAATLLKEALARRGIKVMQGVRRMDALSRMAQPCAVSKLFEVAHVTSQPMSNIVKLMNKVSQNLYAELLLRHIGIAQGSVQVDQYGRPQPAEARGNEMRRSFLEIVGIDLQPLKLHDGSGLTRHNQLTPRATVRLLHYMLTHRESASFLDSLPLAGVDGTLEHRMKGTSAANNVRAKTGMQGAVNALSGYVTTKKGRLLIFSCIANNYIVPTPEIMKIYDQIGALLADYVG